MDLRGKVGVITGASRGIGVVLAQRLAREGVDLVLAARSSDDLDITATTIKGFGRRAIAVATDVADPAQLQGLVDAAESEFGRIDLLVNNAGVEIAGYTDRLDVERIATALHVNLTAPVQLSRLVIPGMLARGHGHICNIASVAGKVARPYSTVYAASKHGLVGFSWSLRAELAERGVEVSVICPGYISGTGMFMDRTRASGVEMPPKTVGLVTPEQVADATIDGIRSNKAEVVVGSPMLRLADVVHALSPDLAMALGRRSGSYEYVRREATGERS